jgi:hypothetical protein
MNSNVFPVEIWHLIFSLACIDDGSTGRSLSLVSTHFREISAPFKYQSIAITHWSQIIAFSQFFCKLPASQKKTLFLFVHHPHPLSDVTGCSRPTDQSSEQSEDDHESSEESDIQKIRDESALPECNVGDSVLEALDVEILFAGDCDSECAPGSDDSWDHSDGVWDSEFEGSLDDDEEREILEDVEYLEAVRDGRLPHDGNTRDDILRDAEIQAFFDNVLQAFQAVLNEISSTLQLLAVYWTSFKLLQIHKLLPPLPCLVELHINRSSIFKVYIYENPPTTALFPELLSLYISGDNPRKLSFSDDLARIAPNLASLRFSMSHFSRSVTSSSLNVVSNVTQHSAINFAIPKVQNMIFTSIKVA